MQPDPDAVGPRRDRRLRAAPHANPYPDTPAHEVLLLGAVGDHQVTEYSLQVEARTMGVPGHDPYTSPDRTRGDEPGWGIDPDSTRTRRADPATSSGTPARRCRRSRTRRRARATTRTTTRPNIPAVQDLKNAFCRSTVRSSTCARATRAPARPMTAPIRTGHQSASDSRRFDDQFGLTEPPQSILKTGWSGAIRCSSLSGASASTPSKKTPTSIFQRFR